MANGWGGARKGAGAPRVRQPVVRKPRVSVPTMPAEHTQGMSGIQARQLLAALEAAVPMSGKRDPGMNPFRLPEFPSAAIPPAKNGAKLAMDSEMLTWAASQWAGGTLAGVAAEGMLFLGYPYLSELAQRPEYRVMSETIATEMTRKWIKLKGTGAKKKAIEKGATEEQADGEQAEADDRNERIKELKDFSDHLKVRDCYAQIALNDGLFGRSHLFYELKGNDDLATPIGNGRDETTEGKVQKDSLQALRVIEPVWCYPTTYNAQNPLAFDWYNPQVWYVMGQMIHVSRIPRFVGRVVPDLLKPAYAFGGLSLTQMAKPYVDIWLTTRESIGKLIHSFSTMVLQTDLATILAPGNGAALMARAQLFNHMRDNQGLFLLNKATEDFKNVSAPLSGLHELQAQAQEHMMSVARIPAVKFTGIQPAGLNASSEGEIRAFYDTIGAFQNKLFRPDLTTTLDFCQITLWGKRDPDIVFDFEPLWELNEKEKGEKRKSEAETGSILIDKGVISPAEERKRIANDPESGYDDIDPEDVPDLAEEEAEGLEPGKGGERGGAGGGGSEGGPGAEDASVLPFDEPAADAAEFNEGDHPRDQGGKFTSGGGGGGKNTVHAPQYGVQHGLFTAHHGSGFAPSAKRTNIGEPIDVSGMTKVSGQKGSNPGGVYRDQDGHEFYVKQGKSPAHVRNEMIAAALYDLAGTPTLQYRPVAGGKHVATEMAKLDKDNVSKLSKAERTEAQRDFAVHAWLANWDAAGLGGDNIGTVKGVPTALDVGGSLEYRAQGAPKGKAFGDKVNEWDSLRDPAANKDAAGLYRGMTPSQLRESARFVTGIPDDKIRKTVESLGGAPELADKLIARKQDIAEKSRTAGAEGDPKSPEGVVVIPAGGKLPVRALNGVKFAPWRAPSDWAAVEGQADLEEPEFIVPKGKQAASGVVIREPDGRVWMVQPKGGYGGYDATFPKGRTEEGLSLQANAIKEAYEESGLKVRIVGLAGDHEGDVTMTRYYLAEREGGDPAEHDGETEGVVLAPEGKAAGFLNRKRDRQVLGMDEANFEESKHPRDADGKFTTGAGGSSELDDLKIESQSGKAAPEGGNQKAGGGSGEPVFTSKKEQAAHLLTKGVTTKEMLAALKWPSISMPQMAKTLGMKLEKLKGPDGTTLYKGTPMTAAELAESKAQAKAAKAVKPPKIEKEQSPPKPPTVEQQIQKAVETAPKPALPAPTEAEMTKAKKSVALQMQYVPGAGELQFTPTKTQAQKMVDAFNAKYAGKELTDKNALAEKVNDFKKLAADVATMAKVEKAHAQVLAQKENEAKAKAAEIAKAKAAADAAAAKAKAAAEKEKLKEQHAEVTKELGITSAEELSAFDSFIDHFGGTAKALTAFKQWQSEAEYAAKKNPGHGYDRLSGFEMGCVRAYTGPQSGWINNAIRDDILTPAQYMFENILNRALDKLPKKTGITRRGLTLPADIHAKLKPGVIWNHRNFASTNAEGWGGNTKLHIEATGKGGAYVAPISSHKGEGETLFKSNLKLMISKTESKGGVLHVYCTEV